MEFQQMLDTLSRLPADTRSEWLRTAAGLVALMLLLLWLERRWFARSNRAASWAFVRVASLLAAPLAVLLLFLPARAVSGMGALAVFYLSLLTVVPLVWFGSHLWAGRRARPAISPGESLALAITGLCILAIPGTAFFAAQRPLQEAARAIGNQRALPADNPQLMHQIAPVATYQLAGVGLVYAQSLLGAPDTKLLRIEQREGGQWPGHTSGSHPTYCTEGNHIHLLWLAREQPPYLRIHWSKPNGAVVRSEFTPTLPAAAVPAATPFSVGLRPDGMDPVVPIARQRIYLVLRKQGEQPFTQMLANGLEAGEKRSTDCVRQGFEVWPKRDGWELQSAVIEFQSPAGGPPLRAELQRSAQ